VLDRKIEIVTCDNESLSADSVRAFQSAVSEDKVSAVVASYIREVALALMLWSARLKMPLITSGAAPNEITKAIHKDHEKNSDVFERAVVLRRRFAHSSHKHCQLDGTGAKAASGTPSHCSGQTPSS